MEWILSWGGVKHMFLARYQKGAAGVSVRATPSKYVKPKTFAHQDGPKTRSGIVHSLHTEFCGQKGRCAVQV